MITQEGLKGLFDYDEHTGHLIRRVYSSNQTAGTVAGTQNAAGYIRVSINSKDYQAHRLIWLLVYGESPPNQIDHINHIRNDNRLINLRLATNLENGMNQKLHSNNPSGCAGVAWRSRDKVWTARICARNVMYNLGSFSNIFDAICARKSAEVRHGFHINHGKLSSPCGIEVVK